MSVTQRLDQFQQRHAAVGFPLAVAYKFVDDQGVYLAALMTYYGFLSLFPLLLLLASALGFALRNDEHLRQQILDSTLSQFPVIGEQLRDPSGLQGSRVAIVIGALTAIYGALGVAQALQHAMNTAWAVPRNRRPNVFKAPARSLLILLTAGVAVLTTTTLSILAGTAGARHGVFSSPTAILTTVAAVAANTVIFGAVFRIATARRLSFADNAPGAVLAAIVWQAMQVFGTAYVSHAVKDRTAPTASSPSSSACWHGRSSSRSASSSASRSTSCAVDGCIRARCSHPSPTTSTSPRPTRTRIATPPPHSSTKASNRWTSPSTMKATTQPRSVDSVTQRTGPRRHPRMTGPIGKRHEAMRLAVDRRCRPRRTGLSQ